MSKKDAHLKFTRLPGVSRAFGEDGTIYFLENGKVAVTVRGPAFFKQGRKIIRRFKADPDLFEVLEAHSYSDSTGSELLYSLVRIADQARFERRLDALISTLRAIRELRLRHFETPAGKRFLDAVQTLAFKLKRPPTKVEITNHLCCAPSQTSKWCQDHGFSWLSNAPAGRPKRSSRRT